MATLQEAQEAIKRFFRSELEVVESENVIDAHLGVLSSGNWTLQFKNDKMDYPIVTLARADKQTTVAAFNGTNGVPLRAGAPIKVRVNKGGSVPYEVVGAGGAAGEQFFTQSNAGMVSAHTHNLNSGNRYVHPRRDFSAGRVQPRSTGASLYVEVFAGENDFYYENPAGTAQIFEGGILNLTSNVPGSGLCRMVKVSLNPATGALVATNGSTYASAIWSSLSDTDVAAISVTAGYYPLAGVRLKNGQTTITEADIFDCRMFNLASASGGGGTVSSVALTMPTSVFDVSGSPITGSGTLAVTFDNQTDNKIFAAPNDGTSGQPSFRAMVARDLPDAPLFAGGRMTLTTNVPVTTSDVTAATALKYTPFANNLISLYSGTRWLNYSFSELSITFSTFTLDRHRLYDIFVYDNAGTLTLEATAWNAPSTFTITNVTNASPPVITTSASHGLSVGQAISIHGVVGSTGVNSTSTDPTWRVNTTPTGTTFTIIKMDTSAVGAPGAYTSGGTVTYADSTATRATTIELLNGVYVKTGATTRRYLGTIRGTYAVNECEDSLLRRYTWNYHNQVVRYMAVEDSTATWTYGTASWRGAHNWLTNRLEFVYGVKESPVRFFHQRRILANAAISGLIGIGENSISANSSVPGESFGGASNTAQQPIARFDKLPTNEGYAYMQALEYASGATVTYTGISAPNTGGLYGYIYG